MTRRDTSREHEKDTGVDTQSRIALHVNGHSHTVEIEHRATLLDLLRDRLNLTGAKRACDRGECGACTVLVDERPMYACQLLAMQVRRRHIVTIEGLAQREDFQPVLQAFVEHDAGQCGFCTPGFAVATYAALPHHADASASQMRWELVGHICRCNAYANIVAAACEASQRRVT